MVTQVELEYYATPGRMTDLSSVAELVDPIPSDVASVCRVVQGLVVHRYWDKAYGLTDLEEREDELQIRQASAILAKAIEIDDRPLIEGRLPQQRVLGNCRDFATLTVAILRHKGIPSRARCGFGTYFTPGMYEDHWVVEWWNGEAWQLTDAQLDDVQAAWLKIGFDPLDVPRDGFIDAGRAWPLYRSGAVEANRFGLGQLDGGGPWFIRGNIARDLAALNKVEMLAWDAWGFGDLTEPMPDEYYDDLAATGARADFDEVRVLYASNERIRVPDVITSYPPNAPAEQVTL